MKKQIICTGNDIGGVCAPEKPLKIAPGRYVAPANGRAPSDVILRNESESKPKLDWAGQVQSYHLFGAA